MRIALLALFHLLSSCGASETPREERVTASAASDEPAGAVQIEDALAEGVRVRGVVERARRTISRWGGEVTLLRLPRADDLRVFVDLDDLEPGARVTLRGDLHAHDPREGTFHDGSELAPESDPLPVPLRLDGATLDESTAPAVETLADLLGAMAPVRVQGTLLGAPTDGSLRVRIGGGTPLCVRTRVVAEETRRFESLVGREVTLEGGLRPDSREPPSPTDECWTLRGLSLSQPTVVDGG